MSAIQTGEQYQYALGSQPLQEYPGGYYRSVSTATFPIASAISGALNILKPGGLRELHWHPADEWAIVINGTCRGLVLEYGYDHPVNSWDWDAGDVWYTPHSECSKLDISKRLQNTLRWATPRIVNLLRSNA